MKQYFPKVGRLCEQYFCFKGRKKYFFTCITMCFSSTRTIVTVSSISPDRPLKDLKNSYTLFPYVCVFERHFKCSNHLFTTREADCVGVSLSCNTLTLPIMVLGFYVLYRPESGQCQGETASK